MLGLALGALAAPAAAAREAAAPTLGLVARQPLTIRGLHFQAAERVRVRVALGGRAFARTATANAAGTVTVRFRLSAGRCVRLSAQAFGSAGSRARLLPTRPAPDCTPSGPE